MKIDLSDGQIFECSELELTQKVSFIFGKNGTGKSTISNKIMEQFDNQEVCIFQGFEGVIDESKHLNAVVLGQENTQISEKIELLRIEQGKLVAEREKFKKDIIKPTDNRENLWTKKERAEKEWNKKDKEISSILTKCAVDIKQQNNPQISITTYNASKLKDELAKARFLQDCDKRRYEEILGSKVKEAEDIERIYIDLGALLIKTNELLRIKIEQKMVLEKIDNLSKRKFAEDGLKIHSLGDKCAFCGNVIEEQVFVELEKYFSADEVNKHQNDIKTLIIELETVKEKLENIAISSKDFYADMKDRMNEIKINIEKKIEEYKTVLQNLLDSLNAKLSDILEPKSKVECDILKDLDELINAYNILVTENNSSDLPKKQQEAKSKLRYHRIKEFLDKSEYNAKLAELGCLKKILDGASSEYNIIKNKIIDTGEISKKIEEYESEIKSLQEQTRNEKVLAENINKKLKNMVAFELRHCEVDDGNGFYQVKSIVNQQVRDVTQLSTGEKNIIAFLYFIEKLNELTEEISVNSGRIIVFDDPMNSNDDNMQYLIIEELQKIISESLKEDDKFILLTHNRHFYLNVKYGRGYNKHDFIHLISNGKKTSIKNIETEKDDFKTSYEALWKEMRFLFQNENASSAMLLNPIRRILETYTKFNGLKQKEFCSVCSGAKKLFDVNSHSIDDLEADLNGKSKEEVIQVLKDCFEENNAKEHFECYWS